ncbi:MAG: FemAB family PEP-CTERM system-associated protein [Myxococcales bacterium]|nr:FemAB family PEP-CTERM system-associated protein [Myxococcales bacterium]
MTAHAPLVLRTLEADDPRWDAYVHGHADGTFFHQQGWRRVIRRAYGDKDHYLYAERAGRIVGLVPLFERGAPPFSRALVSVPVGVEGGVLADDAEAAALLRQAAHGVAEREKLGYVEYKSPKAVFDDLYTKSDLYFTFRQELYGDRDKQLNAIPRKARAVIRASEKAHLKYDFNRTDLEVFYDLYALSLRNLGTPMFPKELFIASLDEHPEADILTVRQCGRVIGCVLNYYYKDVMLPFFAGALPEARDVGINNYLYWAMLESGHARGFRVFDFGRSKADTGPFKFKKNFGMEPTALHYQYDLVGASEPPNVNPTNPKFAKAIDAWQHLPVGLTKLVGPLLSRRIP